MGVEITGSVYCEQRLLLETNGFIDSAFTDNEVLTVMNDYAAKIHCNPDTKEIIAQLGSKHFAIKKANCKTSKSTFIHIIIRICTGWRSSCL